MPVDFAIPSPCVGVCRLGEDNRCLGCLRTPAEIRLWKTASHAQKLEILALLKRRREAMGRVGQGQRRHRRRRSQKR